MDPKSLWATYAVNMASDSLSLKFLNSSYPIQRPAEIMRQRKNKKIKINNELVSLKGTDVIGYFLFQTPGTNETMWYLYDANKLQVLEKACRKNNVPVINLNLSGKGFL